MSDPATLRGLSGLSPAPARLQGSALVMIDLQQTYREGVMRLDGVEPALREAAARRDLRTQLVVERLTGRSAEEPYTNADMQRGIDLEPAAVAVRGISAVTSAASSLE